MLTSCETCGGKIDSACRRCPHCGHMRNQVEAGCEVAGAMVGCIVFAVLFVLLMWAVVS